MMRMATVYRKDKHLYFHASSKTTYGVWIAASPFSKVSVEALIEEKGRAIEVALRGSAEGVDHPTDFRELMTPLLSLANVTSWSTFSRKAQCCTVEMDDKSMVFIPHDNMGSREGFEPRIDKALRLSAGASRKEVGECLDRTLETCT